MNTQKLAGKVAVVTGASKGIGAGIAKHLAAEGAAVVVNYASSKEDADRVVDEITKRGGQAIAVQGDVARKTDIERLFAATNKAFGRLDILVNNAGVYQFTPLEEVTENEFHREFNTNVLGLILATREAVKYFGAEGGGIDRQPEITRAQFAYLAIYHVLIWQCRRGRSTHRKTISRIGRRAV